MFSFAGWSDYGIVEYMKKTRYKEIFIFIVGSTPQVITETICNLATGNLPVYPDELCIITTTKGREIAEAAFFKQGILKQLLAEYDLSAYFLNSISFIIPKDRAGVELEDIRNSDENELMGDLITSLIKEKTADMSARLHCSIAGGRKTMSFYLGAALQLFGRPWDKLYHVLVSPEFEKNPEFFYKPKKDRLIECNGKKINTKSACITLAELPFIRLRNKLSLEGSSFRELVQEGQREIDIALIQPELKVMLREGAIKIGQKIVRFTPLHFVIYLAYLKRKTNHCKYPERPYCYDCSDCFPSLLELSTKTALEEMAKDYMQISPSKVHDLLYRHKEGLSQEILRQAISKIKRFMLEELKDEALALCCAITTSFRGYANTRHGIRLEKGKIKIDG